MRLSEITNKHIDLVDLLVRGGIDVTNKLAIISNLLVVVIEYRVVP